MPPARCACGSMALPNGLTRVRACLLLRDERVVRHAGEDALRGLRGRADLPAVQERAAPLAPLADARPVRWGGVATSRRGESTTLPPWSVQRAPSRGGVHAICSHR